MTRTLSELLALVKQLREEVGQQRNEIAYLRQLIENCAGCKEHSAPLRDTCASHSPCYPGKFSDHPKEVALLYIKLIPLSIGVSCYDTETGTRCGHCPRGYVGDGKKCKPGVTCDDKPCFRWVSIAPKGPNKYREEESFDQRTSKGNIALVAKQFPPQPTQSIKFMGIS